VEKIKMSGQSARDGRQFGEYSIKGSVNVIKAIADKKIGNGVTEEMNVSTSQLPNNALCKESTLHQLSPYIGKMKPNIIKDIILTYTEPYTTILDPFSGSGTVALEALTFNRNAIANDINLYAVTLTKAKMYPPHSLDEALKKAEYYLNCSKKEISESSLSETPEWVRSFFHPTTLKEIIALSRLLRQNEEHFLLACLLGILHHQRPGFLSYPSSHVVPYLRMKKFPKEQFPELYYYREVRLRLINKIKRTFRHFPKIDPMLFRECKAEDARKLKLPEGSIDAVVSSPPYMNALDYGRDNRLRLWFLGVTDYKYYDNLSLSTPKDFYQLMDRVMHNLYYMLKPKSPCIFVVGEVKRNNNSINTSSIIREIALSNGGFKVLDILEDEIPYARRARKEGKMTKKEWTVIMRKEG